FCFHLGVFSISDSGATALAVYCRHLAANPAPEQQFVYPTVTERSLADKLSIRDGGFRGCA
ncbi:MAG: hypothetical protein KIS63_18415, partial [Caldilineales bacterium]|nr:hypothetical protein [Caldilineales bacterium]